METESSLPLSPSKAALGTVLEAVAGRDGILDAKSCIEFLIISLTNTLEIKPKQAAGLLLQGNKYLRKVMKKGLKGDFSPCKDWYREVYSNLPHLTTLISIETDLSIFPRVLSALTSGLISIDLETNVSACKLLSKLSFDLEDRRMTHKLWEWLSSNLDEIITPMIALCQKQDTVEAALDALLHLSSGRLPVLFTSFLAPRFPTPSSYLHFLSTLSQHLFLTPSTHSDLQSCGLIPYWTDLALTECENTVNNPYGLSSLSFLYEIWTRCYAVDSESVDPRCRSILSTFKRATNDANFGVRVSAVCYLFAALEFFADIRSAIAPIVYKSLAVLTVEEPPGTELERLLLVSLSYVVDRFEDISLIPVIEIANRKGVEMIDVCGRVYLSDLVFARAATISFATIVNRFGENEIMQEYLGKFVKVMIGMVLGYAIQGDAGLSPFESLSRLSQSSMHFSLLKWLLNLSLPDLNLKLAHILSALHQQYKTATGKDCNRLKDLLAEIGYFPDEIQGGWGEGGGREDAEEEEVIDTILPLGTAELIESPVARPKEIASFPYSRIHHDLARISQTRHEREAQNKLYQEQLSKEAALRYRSIKQQLEIRKIEQKVMRGVADDDSLAIYPYNSTTKAPLHLDESHIYEFSPEEDLDLYHLRTVQKRYKRALKAIFTKYSGTGFLARRDVGSSFDNVTERKERMTEAELGKALTMGKVVPMLIGKEEVRSVMKGYCARIAHQHDLSSIDFPNFCDLLPQLSFSIYHHYSWPPAIQFKELMIYLQKQCDGLGVSWEVFEDGGVGCGDRDVARRLNEMLREDGDTPLPTNYELHYLSDISYSHSVPPCLPLPHSFTISLEIIDSLLHSAFDVHILEPQITITSLPYAKGKPISPSKHTTVLKIPRPPINEIYTTHTLSPVLKLELAKMEAIMQPFALECAQTLENMLISVDLGLNRVINRGNGVKIQRKSDIYKEKIEFRLNKPEKSDFSHKKPTEPPLRIRISIEKHAEKLKKAKEAEENRKFLEAEAAKRNSVKLLREKDARHRALKLYLEQKESERVRKSAEMEEIVRELEEKRKKAQETSYKQLQSRLDAVIKSKQDQWRLIREKSSLSPSKIRENKSLHHQFAAKMMEKDKERAVLKLEKAREMKEFEGKEEVKGMMEKAGRQIEGFFRFFCRRGEFRMEMEGERELELQDFAKMAADVSLVPTLLSPELLSFLFKSLTKHKPPNNGRPLTLNLSDFTQSLFVIADLCKEQLNDMRGEPGETLNPGTLAALLGFLRMDRTAGEMNEFLRGLLEGRKREGSRARRVSRSKRSPSSLLSIPPLPLTTSHDSDYSDVRISRDPTPFRGVVSSRRGTSQLTKSFELSKSSQRVRDSGYD